MPDFVPSPYITARTAIRELGTSDSIQQNHLHSRLSAPKNTQGKEKVLPPLTFQLALMEFRQELSNSIGGDCKGDSRGHLQRVDANHITILAREEMSFGHQVVQTEQIGGSGVSPLGPGYRGASRKVGFYSPHQ